MDVLVIGGTGVISTEIVNRLFGDSCRVTVFNRGLRAIRYRAEPELLRGDKNDRASFIDTFRNRNFDAVIDMISYNPEDAALTLNALQDRAGHFIFTSTVAAYKRPLRTIPIRESDPLFDTPVVPYGYHKAQMERFLAEKMAGGIPITIIRPSLTYGIGCANIGVMRNNYGIVRRIREKKPIVVFGDGTNPWSWTFAPDLAKAYSGVLCRPACFGQAYHAVNDERRMWDDLYLEFGRLIGEEPRLIHISTEMLMAAAPDVFSHVREEKMYAGIYDSTKINRDVPEFVCSYKLKDIIGAVYEWYTRDAGARAIDEQKDLLEDSIAEKYCRCLSIMKEG
ncbi:NAD-dependent epimerase/dehydratase family protein [Treponema sp. OttesenSCG-928-L16]|nr:NAD-dependent epimerase/dehydratase family protein [Treponema sp. OttesenSCG-928-L16]